MKIFLIFSILIITILIIGREVFYSAKRNLFKDQAAWSGKDIKIKHINSREVKDSSKNDNYLKMIAEESKIYLDDQSKKAEE